MRYLYLVLALLISSTIFGASRMPCQYIDFDELTNGALPPVDMLDRDVTIKFRNQEIRLLQQCVEQYSVCIVEMPPKVSTWFSNNLKPPVDNNFNPWKSVLAFGLLQYTDEKTGEKICMAAHNLLSQAVPWYGSSWVIGNGLVKKYEIWDAPFTLAITPRKLYDALLMAHQESVKDNHWIKSYNFIEPKD
jgi:hypothetical protein